MPSVLTIHRILGRVARAGVAAYPLVRTCVRLRGGGRLAALGALFVAALLLWSALPAGAQTGPPVLVFADVTFGSGNSATLDMIFDRPVRLAGTPRSMSLRVQISYGGGNTSYWADDSGTTVTYSGNTVTYTFTVDPSHRDNRTSMSAAYDDETTDYIHDGSDNRVATFPHRTLPYGTRPSSPAAPASPDPSNFARGAVQWEPVGGMHAVPARIGEISSNKPKDATATLDLSEIVASVREDLRARSRGFYVTTLVESASERSHLLRGLEHELARGSPLLKVSIWHVYRRASTGINTVELLGEVFSPRTVNLLVEPVEICLPAPAKEAERARIAVRGRLDRDWTILETRLTEDGRVCAETTRVSWFTIVLAPEAEDAAA